jgi:6-phosphogluconolactonase/glucosamine-6-phosphate isomerase/deaminase
VKFYKIQSAEPVAKFLADTILDRLFKGQKVLWLVGGGSGIKVAVAASQILKKQSNLSSLTFTLTDERFGAVGHGDSNWKQLLEAGFSLPGAQLDEAVLYAVGEAKKPVLKKLNEAISLSEQPAQFLKTLPKLTVYNDQIGEDL